MQGHDVCFAVAIKLLTYGAKLKKAITYVCRLGACLAPVTSAE